MLNHLLPYGWAGSPERLVIVAAVTVGFALLARTLRGVNWSGMWIGGLVCFALFAAAGPAAFAALAVLFVLTWVSTRLRYRHKQALGLAERREGRNAWQVSGNLAVAALAAVAFGFTGNPAWILATLAALAEAATDTVASEVGQSIWPTAEHGPSARLITNWTRVPAGTDGGVTLLGSIAGLFAGSIVAVVGVAGGLIALSELWMPVSAGFAGMLIDSLLGATLQRRNWMSNQTVNFFATLTAAAIAFALAMIFP